jgi:uncharacterized protein (TIGR00297 family)
MPDQLSHWMLAAAAATIVAVAARARRSLSRSGALAAAGMGTILVGTGGWWAGVLLVAFFLSSSILSRAGADRHAIAQARGSERDAVQVLANGGIALASGILFAFTGASGWIAALAGSLAAANADTWSTEIGRTSTTSPRLVTTWRTVPAGTSGAVSARGLGGALGGGALIGVLAAAGWQWDLLPGDIQALPGLAAVTVGGVAGSLVDSLLGATVQDRRWCETCRKETEQRIHRCGTRSSHVGGVSWIDNDVVNVSSAMTGAAVAAILLVLL